LDYGGEICGGGIHPSAGESVCFGVKEEYAHCVGTAGCLSMESFFVTPLYRMNGNSSHESSLYQGPYPGAVSGQDAPPGPIQPAALGLTAQQGGRRGTRKNRKNSRKASRKNRKASRKNRKASRKNRKASRKNRKASRKNRKASRKASRKIRKNSRKNRKANRKNSRKNRRNNRRNNM